MNHGDHHPTGSPLSANEPAAMAASMEADIRTRFWVALALSVLVVVISPMGEMVGIRLPLSATVRSWSLLVLTTPIVFWCGWIFVAGAFRSLVSRRLDMSVLIAVGVLAAYVASVYLTIIGSKELFYEAAAMLVTFVLFGQRL
jgi:Cu2+-exporting ATPase